MDTPWDLEYLSIGNLADITFRAIDVLKNSEYIFLVKHSMREDKLKGINKLGLNISN